jgi:hypothetical protein
MDPIHGVIKPSDIGNEGHVGLTKRELFAAMFMSANGVANALVNKQLGAWTSQAEDACDAADAMIAVLEKKNDT